MNENNLFNAGPSSGIVPEGDPARQAIHSLRGYVYQALATALAWVDIGEHDRLFLEVAEDYAIMAQQALSLKAVQIKDTEGSGAVTLKSRSVRDAVTAFVDLVERNPGIQVNLRFWTTSEIGIERDHADRPTEIAGLEYWRKVDAGADISPLRSILEERFPEPVRAFCTALDDDEVLRRELIQRIRWDCGKPDLSTLRQKLEARLVVVGRDRFDIPAEEAKRLADTLIYEVLNKSVIKGTQNRVLGRADLYTAIDAASRISFSRSEINSLRRRVPDLAGLPIGDLGTGPPLTIAETNWIIDGSILPTPQGIIARSAVESQIASILENHGAVVLVGSSGLGKSTVSRAVAVAHAGAFFMVGFRGHDANEARHRLDMLFGRIGDLSPGALILEDLNCINDTSVALSLVRVIESLRRRDRYVLITCYQKPSLKALNDIGFNQRCVVDCPYFSEEEVQALISENKGDADKWGRVAYTVGRGHPQLTHAFVAGMATRKWPVKEIEDIIAQGLSSNDTDAARNEARRSLVAQLPKETRNMLYRLSLVSGQFDRALVLAISEIPPQIPQPGECIDRLVGPWLETAGSDLFRVSPLVRNSGSEMLSTDEQQRIHESIAVQMLRKETLYTSEVDQVMVHALLGKSATSLVMLARGILSTDNRSLERLAEHSLFLYLLTNRPIYGEDPFVSGMLRLTQFKLAATASERNNISDIVTALFNEISDMPEGELRRNLEAMAVITVFNTMGVANYLDNWIDLLLRFKDMPQANEALQHLMANVQGTTDTRDSKFVSDLFIIGSADLASVNRLEYIINKLDKVEASERALLLVPIDEMFSNYSGFINGPWIRQQHREDFDAADTATRYQRMAKKTRNWNIRRLSLECSVAQAVMLDEYQNNKEGALAVLEEATTAVGSDVILEQTKARIYQRHDEHELAFQIFRSIADQLSDDNPVRRTSALREAAISAAKCNQWSKAEEWFLDAQNAARLAQNDNMDVMAIGLGADSAVAAFEAGDVHRALTRLVEALEALESVDPEKTLFTAYCHRVIRHAVLWVKSCLEEVGKQSGKIEPGACSNPDPAPAIREIPLTHIDVAWYVLAQAETTANLNAGITATLEARLSEGPILVMEAGLRIQMIQADIDRFDAVEFATHFTAYVEGVVHVAKEADRLRTTFNSLAPQRGQIPTLNKHALSSPEAEQIAKEVIMAYGIYSALAGRSGGMVDIETALNNQFNGSFPGKTVFYHWNKGATLPDEFDQSVVNIIKGLLQKNYVKPKSLFWAAVGFFQWINRSDFKSFLTPRLASWLRSGWTEILAIRSFRLSRPLQTVPPVEEVLSIPTDDKSFVAKLILVTSEAVDISLAPAYRDTLKAMTEETESTTQDSPPDLGHVGKGGS